MSEKEFKKIEHVDAKNGKKITIVVLFLIVITMATLYIFERLEIIDLKKQVTGEDFNLIAYKAKLKTEIVKEIAENEKEQEQIMEERDKTKLTDKVKEDKMVEQLKITDIQIIEDETIIEATIINEGDSTKDYRNLKVKFLDKLGIVKAENIAYAGKLEPHMNMKIRINIPERIGEIENIQFTL